MKLKIFANNGFEFSAGQSTISGKASEKELEKLAVNILKQLPNSKILPFANKIATAMDEIKSSHVYFIVQQAFGEAEEWESVQDLLTEVIKATNFKNKQQT